MLGAAGAAYLLVLNKDTTPLASTVAQPATVHLLHAAVSLLWLGIVLGTGRRSDVESYVALRERDGSPACRHLVPGVVGQVQG